MRRIVSVQIGYVQSIVWNYRKPLRTIKSGTFCSQQRYLYSPDTLVTDLLECCLFFGSWFCSISAVIWSFRTIPKAKWSSFLCFIRFWSQIWSTNTIGSRLSIASKRIILFNSWIGSNLLLPIVFHGSIEGLLKVPDSKRTQKTT